MLKLIDLINLNNVNLGKFKIHFAIGSDSRNRFEPLYEFFNNRFKEWQEYQTKRNFQCDTVISLIHYDNNKWLFVGAFTILNHQYFEEPARYIYQTEEINGLEDLVGKAVIYFDKKFRASYVWGHNYENELLINQLLEDKITIEEFPGYNKINSSYQKLKVVFDNNIMSWKTALSIVKGIYLISDTKTGKLYVGSATGENGFWQRWNDYIYTGHGGDVELKALLKKHGKEYIQHFSYSILEIADTHTSIEDIVSRESYWKNVLLSKEFGYNSN